MKFFFVFLILAAVPFLHSAKAHGVRESLEKVVGDYVIDIGYDAFLLQAKEQTQFDFNLFAKETEEEVSFTHVWVKIVKEDKALFAGRIHKTRLGETQMTYVFPSQGAYELSVLFQNEDDSQAETSFPLLVEQPFDFEGETKTESGFSLSLFFAGFVGLLLGFILASLKKKL